MTTNFNTSKPTPGRRDMWRTVTIGYKCEFDGDDYEVVADENGEPIPCDYRVPVALTANQLLNAVTALGGPAKLEALAADGGMDAAVELLGAIVGADMLLEIASNPTVGADEYASFLMFLVESLDLSVALPGGDPANPTNPALAG